MKLKYRVIERFRGKYPIGSMCRMFEVSRSGCYAWRKRQGKPEKDQWLVDLIIDCQQRSKQTCGCRRVRRWLERRHGRKVSIKAILRIMRKLYLLSQVRRKPYRNYQQAVHKYPNLLQRTFAQPFPNRFWATDITYIPAAKGMVYLCAVLDLCGKMVLAYRIGGDMTSSLVTDNTPPPPVRLRPGTKIFSDTGTLFSASRKNFPLPHCHKGIRGWTSTAECGILGLGQSMLGMCIVTLGRCGEFVHQRPSLFYRHPDFLQASRMVSILQL